MFTSTYKYTLTHAEIKPIKAPSCPPPAPAIIMMMIIRRIIVI